MSRDFRLYLDDVLESIARIEKCVLEHDAAQAQLYDSIILDAIMFNLEIIGEAANNIPEEIRTAHPEVDWRGIINLRNKLIHHYHGIIEDIVWDVARNKLPVLKKQIERILNET